MEFSFSQNSVTFYFYYSFEDMSSLISVIIRFIFEVNVAMKKLVSFTRENATSFHTLRFSFMTKLRRYATARDH